MQTYTHMLIGAAIGAAVDANDPLVWAAAALGGVLPDVVQIPLFVAHRLRGRSGPVDVPRAALVLKQAAHSLIVWGAILALASSAAAPVALGFALGGLGHCVVDVLTHHDPRYARWEAGFAWPLRIKLSDRFGIWDYRIDHGVLRPKRPEALVDALAVIVFAALLWIG